MHTLSVGTKQVDDFNTGHKNIIASTELYVSGGRGVDGIADLWVV